MGRESSCPFTGDTSMTGDAWNIPNSLTLLRILLIPVFVGLML